MAIIPIHGVEGRLSRGVKRERRGSRKRDGEFIAGRGGRKVDDVVGWLNEKA